MPKCESKSSELCKSCAYGRYDANSQQILCNLIESWEEEMKYDAQQYLATVDDYNL